MGLGIEEWRIFWVKKSAEFGDRNFSIFGRTAE